MGRQPKLELAVGEDDAPEEPVIGDEPLVSGSFASSSDDICTNLLERYGKSAAPQHRHLCACACAMRSLLTEEGLPLNNASYFAAVLTAIRQADLSDHDEVAALSAFLSILVPLLPARSLPETKAKEAASDVMSLLQSSREGMTTPTFRSLIGALGVLVLCLDLDDWSTLQTPVEMLFRFAVDRRPKIRRSAQESLERVFAAFGTSTVRKKISGFLISLFKKYVCIDTLTRSQIRNLAKSEHMEALHVLYLMKLIASNVPKKTILKLLPDIYKLLGCQFSIFTRHALMVLEVFMGCLDMGSLASESEKVIATLSSYISNRKNHIDTILSASTLLKNILNRLKDVNPKLWIDHFPLIFSLLSGFLDSKTEAASQLAGILRELINFHIDMNEFPCDKDLLLNNTIASCPESRAMEAVCIILEKKLFASDNFPNEHILAVISDLFLKLGQISFIFMKNIILKLSQRASDMEVATELNQLQVCLGSAIIAIGSERMLSLFPVSFVEETYTCSNVWLLPLLKKYMSGEPLQSFIENLLPVASSIMAASKQVEDSLSVDKLETYMIRILDLLPSFCHHNSNSSENFKVLAPILIVALKEKPSLHKTVSASLKVLVRSVTEADTPEECVPASSEDVVSDQKVIIPRSLKKSASKNMKAMASCSMDVIDSCREAFFSSEPENRPYLKDAVESLTSIIGASNIRKFFLTIAKKLEFEGNEDEVADKQRVDDSEKVAVASSGIKDEKLRSLAIELMWCIISRANKDLINEIFNCIRPYISAVNGPCTREAYLTLSKILKEHNWFISEHTDDLMEMLLGTKSIHDADILKSRFSCFEILLTNFVKSKEEIQKKKAFPLLNEIILALKDSDAEVRKSAHDSLCAASTSLKETQSDDLEAPICQLFTMLMGYFYGSSPHIKSGAVAALSLLLYKDTDSFISVPNLLSSVLALLKKKETEVIKSVLGFIKVLVCSLQADELGKQLPDIVPAIIPWSSVSKHHFRLKVKLIFEIMLRKCGSTSVNEFVPKKFQDFVKNVKDYQGNSTQKEDHKPGSNHVLRSLSAKRDRKRKRNATSDDKHFGNHERKKEKLKKSKKNTVYMNDPGRAHREDRGKGSKSDHYVSKRKSHRSSKKPGKGKRVHDRDNVPR